MIAESGRRESSRESAGQSCDLQLLAWLVSLSPIPEEVVVGGKSRIRAQALILDFKWVKSMISSWVGQQFPVGDGQWFSIWVVVWFPVG